MNTSIQGIKSVFRHPDTGLLIMRAAVGLILLWAGYNKFMAGETALNAVGANIKYIGLDVGTNNLSTMFFGVLAAAIETIGGLGLVVGFFYRTSAVLLFLTMLVATLMKFDTSGGEIAQYGYPMLVGFVVLGLLFTGPGRISLQKD